MEAEYDSDGTELVSDTWNKVIRDCKQIGFREGAFDAQEETFQKSFDIGYENGFKNGFLLGKCKGNIMSKSGSNTSASDNQPLKATRKAFCVICEDSKLLDVPVEEIIQIQEEKISKIHKQLKEECTKSESGQ